MPTWKSRGLRGSALEEMINYSNEKYKESKIALVQKIPTPIKPIEIDNSTRHITLAYFEQKSTVDYIGAVQGFPVCFDAKECNSDTFALANIHIHQFEFMESFENQGGVAFIILDFTHRNEIYYIPFSKIKEFFDRMNSGGRKSFKIDELNKDFILHSHSGVPVHYLEGLEKDLESRKNNN
ncbi:MAG: Holliday junction resolvase RecU [Lachnospiraceae bacterium]|nr:Holliday junction resolvase RecU [Lachnospiraceae bacterium]